MFVVVVVVILFLFLLYYYLFVIYFHYHFYQILTPGVTPRLTQTSGHVPETSQNVRPSPKPVNPGSPTQNVRERNEGGEKGKGDEKKGEDEKDKHSLKKRLKEEVEEGVKERFDFMKKFFLEVEREKSSRCE
jgi:hypothetical protein